MADCIFCKIAAGEIPCEQILSSENVIAFADINPKAPIHILVVPKAHIPTLSDFPTDGKLLGEITTAIQKLTQEKGIAQSGYRLILNNGPDSGQEVDHVHWHILGGKAMGPMVCT